MRIVTRTADGARYLSHFKGEGRVRAQAVQMLWLWCQSAVGHGAGTPWEATARELAAVAEGVAKAEGLL